MQSWLTNPYFYYWPSDLGAEGKVYPAKSARSLAFLDKSQHASAHELYYDKERLLANGDHWEQAIAKKYLA